MRGEALEQHAHPDDHGPYAALAGTCTNAVGTAVCASGVCDLGDNKCGYADGNGVCDDTTAATVCRGAVCTAGVCGTPTGCTDDASCPTSQFCNTQSKVCTSKLPNGTAVPTITGHTPALTGTCSAAVGTAVCVSGVCDTTDNKCGFADGDGTCTVANAGQVCRSAFCGSTGICATPAAIGCIDDSNCNQSQYCNTETKACVPKLANGESVPTVSGHAPDLNGKCSLAVGLSVCVSGVCDTADDKCGYADGHGKCADTTAAIACRSKQCSTAGVCGPNPPEQKPDAGPTTGCSKDSDCADNQYCDTSAKTCTPKLPNGQKLPSGKCDPAVAAAVCVAGVCDVTDDKCGFTDGNGACTSTTASVVCRSQSCGPDNKCAYLDDGALAGGGCNTTGGGQQASIAVLIALGLMLRGRRGRVTRV